MTGRAFLDSNVLVYLFDDASPAKKRIAGALVQQLVETNTARVISTQVLQEAYFAITGKLGVESARTLTLLQGMVESGFTVVTVDVPLVWKGAGRSASDKLSFWDGLIVESAISAQCTRLYTEDAQLARTAAHLEVINPFR